MPPDILEEIKLFNYSPCDGQKLFTNQRNIKKISTDKAFVNRIEWNSLKLKSLYFYPFEDFEHILAGQDELKKFLNSDLTRTSLKAICDELKSLVDLNINDLELDQGEPANFQLSKLRKLKTFRIGRITGIATEINNFLRLLRSDSIESFTLYGDFNVDELTIKQLAVNMPRLVHLNIDTQSASNVINAIIQNFPNLEDLKFKTTNKTDAFIFQDGLKHNKLRKIKIEISKSDNIELSKLINCCQKLEEFEISSPTGILSMIEIRNRNNGEIL
jgi:hypothetical protein